MDSDSSPFRKQSEAGGALPLWCDACRSDEHLVLHSIDSMPTGTDGLLVQVIYACTSCGSIRAHAASFDHVAALLNASDTVPGLLHFGGQYLHCGKPLTLAGTALRSIRAPLSAAETDSDLPDVVLASKIMHCTCGFRLELPA